MKKSFIFLLITLVCSVNTFAQRIEGTDAQENIDNLSKTAVRSSVIRKFDFRYEGVKGSPFYNEEWMSGTIEFVNDSIASELQLKYNIYEDELILLKPNVGAVYIEKENVRSFILIDIESNKKIFFRKYPHSKKQDTMLYYRVIFGGKVDLLEHTKMVFEKADYQGGYSNDKTYDEFKKYPDFYSISASKQIPQKIKTTANGVAKLFPDNQDQVKWYIQNNLLDCRQLVNLVKIFDYYEQLPK